MTLLNKSNQFCFQFCLISQKCPKFTFTSRSAYAGESYTQLYVLKVGIIVVFGRISKLARSKNGLIMQVRPKKTLSMTIISYFIILSFVNVLQVLWSSCLGEDGEWRWISVLWKNLNELDKNTVLNNVSSQYPILSFHSGKAKSVRRRAIFSDTINERCALRVSERSKRFPFIMRR